MAITAEMTTSVMELYTAYFNRAADKDGVDYWLNEMDTNGWTIDQVAQSFAQQTEYTAIYAGLTNAQIVAQVYTNVLGRTADTAGAAYWEAELDGGTVPVSQFIQAVVNAAKEDVDNLGDDDIVANKTAVSQYYYDNNRNDTNVSLTAVTADAATVDTAKAALDAVINAGETFTLTTGTETITGTALNDTINGVTSTLTSAKTLDTTDIIDGGAGTDTLNITMNTSFTGMTGTGAISNVENITLANATTVAKTFDATGITGATKYTIDATTGAISTLSDLSAIAEIEVSKQQSALTVNMDSTFTALNGTADAVTVSITDVGTADNAATTANEQVNVALTLTDMETVNLNASGTNVVSFAGTDMTTLNIAGDGNVKVTAVTTTTTSIDGSASTGNVNLDTTATTATLTTVSTGTGDDAIAMDVADALANAEISMGDGADTLTLTNTGAAKTVQYSMSGVETVAVGAQGAALTFSGTNASGITTINATSTLDDDASFVNMGAADLTLNVQGANASAKTVQVANTGTTVVNFTAASTLAANTTQGANALDVDLSNAANVTINAAGATSTTGTTAGAGISAANATSVTLNVASALNSTTNAELTSFTSDIIAAKATNLVVAGEGLIQNQIIVDKATEATISTGSTASTNAIDLQAALLETLTVTAGKGLDMSSSDLSSVQVASLTATKGFIDLASENMAKVSTLTLAGAHTTSQISIQNLGGNNDYSMNVTASGLKAGLVLGTMNVAAGYDITLDASEVTGAVTTSTIGNGQAGKNVTLITTGTGGAVTYGAIDATGTVTITNSSTGAFQYGDITTTGDVVINADGTSGAVTTGAITGNNVTVDVSDTIGGVDDLAADGTDTMGVITAKTSATVALSELQDNTQDIIAGTGSTALTVAITGGIGDDDITITGVATNTSITVTGNLDIGTNSIDIDNTNSTEATSTISIAGLSNYDTANIQLDVSSAETVTLGSGVDTLVALAGNYGDTVASFTGGASGDVLNLTAIGTFAGTAVYAEGSSTANATIAGAEVIGVTDNAAADWSDVLAVMNAAIDTTGVVTTDTIIAISNGTDTRLYFYEDDANAAAIEAGELTDIVVTLTGVDVNADTFVAANFTL